MKRRKKYVGLFSVLGLGLAFTTGGLIIQSHLATNLNVKKTTFNPDTVTFIDETSQDSFLPILEGEQITTFDDKEHSVKVTNLPEGVNANYSYQLKVDEDTYQEVSTSSITNAGEYKLVINFTSDNPEYKGTSSCETSLTIKPYWVPVQWEDKFADGGYFYTGDLLELPRAYYKDVNGNRVDLELEEENNKEFRDVDTYVFIITGHNSNYRLSGNVSIEIKVKQKSLSVASEGLVTYTGSEVTFLPEGFDSNLMTISNNTATSLGSYTATLSLKDKTNYSWDDGTTADKVINWKIDYDFEAEWNLSSQVEYRDTGYRQSDFQIVNLPSDEYAEASSNLYDENGKSITLAYELGKYSVKKIYRIKDQTIEKTFNFEIVQAEIDLSWQIFLNGKFVDINNGLLEIEYDGVGIDFNKDIYAKYNGQQAGLTLVDNNDINGYIIDADTYTFVADYHDKNYLVRNPELKIVIKQAKNNLSENPTFTVGDTKYDLDSNNPTSVSVLYGTLLENNFKNITTKFGTPTIEYYDEDGKLITDLNNLSVGSYKFVFKVQENTNYAGFEYILNLTITPIQKIISQLEINNVLYNDPNLRTNIVKQINNQIQSEQYVLKYKLDRETEYKEWQEGYALPAGNYFLKVESTDPNYEIICDTYTFTVHKRSLNLNDFSDFTDSELNVDQVVNGKFEPIDVSNYGDLKVTYNYYKEGQKVTSIDGPGTYQIEAIFTSSNYNQIDSKTITVVVKDPNDNSGDNNNNDNNNGNENDNGNVNENPGNGEQVTKPSNNTFSNFQITLLTILGFTLILFLVIFIIVTIFKARKRNSN